MPRTLCVLAVLTLSLVTAAAPAADFYVATDGNDAWSGTLASPNAAKTDGPFATLQRARDAVRETRAAVPAETVTVTSARGCTRCRRP